MKIKMNRWILIGVAILAVFLLSACSGPDEHIWLKSSGWSRAVFLGNTTVNDPVPMTLDDKGQIYFMFVSGDKTQTQKTFEITALAADGNLLWKRSLDKIAFTRPDNPSIAWDSGNLRLFWVDSESLYTLLLDEQGTPRQNEPVLLSADIAVATYSFAVDDSGAITLWFAGARKNPGVYALSISDGSGEIISIDSDGIRPQIRYDQKNTLHATWLQYPVGYGTTQIVYGDYLQGTAIGSVQPQVLHELSVGPSSGLDGPMMGIDSDEVYVFWTVVIRVGLDAGSTRTNYLHFPLGKPALSSKPALVSMPSGYGSDLENLSTSTFDAGERVSLESGDMPETDNVREIIINPMQSDEVAIVFRSSTQYLWRKVKEQVNIAYFYDGEPVSYQPLSFTTTLSTSPNLVNSADHQLYAVWLEKIETNVYAVYFASTSSAIEKTLSRSTGRELGRVAAQVSFGMLVGILMAPIAAGVWVVAPLIVLFVFAPLRKLGSTRTQEIISIISLGFAITAFWFDKLAMLPGMMDHVPFSAWIPEISSTLATILRLGVPVASSLFAIFIAWFYTYRQSNKSTLYFLLIYVGVDSLLTAAVYAVLIYGAI